LDATFRHIYFTVAKLDGLPAETKVPAAAFEATARTRRAGRAREYSISLGGSEMSEDAEKVYSTGLTLAQAEELHRNLIDGTRIFGAVSLVAHLLAYIYSPWMQ
jgi:light-harvesting protein B-800-850 beta chain